MRALFCTSTLWLKASTFATLQIGELKGFVDLVKVVDINAIGRKLELKVAKGRGTYKLIADTEKIARDWAKLVRAEVSVITRSTLPTVSAV